MIYESKTYHVQDKPTARWGFFTIAPAIGLLQIESDMGIYAYRWDTYGGDFVAFLLRLTDDYLEDKLMLGSEPWKIGHLTTLLTHLWPLFIETLKAELAGEEVKPT